MVGCVWNVTAHSQKPDFVFRQNERVYLNRQGRQFSRLLAAEVCASAVVMLDTPYFRGSVKITGYPLLWPVYPLTSPPMRHCVPSHFNWTLFVPMCSIFHAQYIYFQTNTSIITTKSTFKATYFSPIGPSSGLIIRTGSVTSSAFWDPKLFT